MLPKIIPDKLPGAVCEQYLRCHKVNCRCARGELHGPYWYRFWRDARGRQHKEYVRKGDLGAVRAACEAWREEVGEARGLLARAPTVVKWYLQNDAKVPETDEDWELWLTGPQDVRRLVDLALQEELGPRFRARAFRILLELYQPMFDEMNGERNLALLGWRQPWNATLDDADR